MSNETIKDDAPGPVSESVGGLDGEDWDPIEEAMAVMLGEGLTHAVVADTLEISTKTVQRRVRDDRFRARVMELRRERLATTTAKLVALSDSALDVIREVMGSEDDRLRFRASETVLRLGRQHHREEAMESELRARMDAIEDTLEDRGGGEPS